MWLVILRFLTDNPWRTGCLILSVIIGLGILAYRFQGVKLSTAVNERMKVELQLKEIEVTGQIAQAKLDLASTELTHLRKRQITTDNKLAELLKQWPVTCEQAGVVALEIFRKRGEE